MSKHARTSGLIVALACAAGGCAAPGYNPPERSRAAGNCPVDEVRVCRDHYPSRLEREGEPPMICTCERVGGVH